jgi:SAM-dependent methyltransferase
MRGWTSLYRFSLELGLRSLRRDGPNRQALIRLVVPLDPSRYLELPDTLEQLEAAAGERVLDLASPKLPAVALARRGVMVTSVDALESEVEAWRRMAGTAPNVTFEVGDGRALDLPDASFDRAYSISGIEHIAGDGDRMALSELARVVKPGGRVVVTVPYSKRYHEDWRDEPVYGNQGGENGRYFFERWYDEERIAGLVASAPTLELTARRVSRLWPNWHRAYTRLFPWLIVLGPFYGLLARQVDGPPGDVIRLTFTKRDAT